VRLLVRDDEEQFRRAELAFRRATAAGGAWVGGIVLVEVSWVLRVAYERCPRSRVRRFADYFILSLRGVAERSHY